MENEKLDGELEIAAEKAYQTATTSSDRTVNTQNEDEFDFDESVFTCKTEISGSNKQENDVINDDDVHDNNDRIDSSEKEQIIVSTNDDVIICEQTNTNDDVICEQTNKNDDVISEQTNKNTTQHLENASDSLGTDASVTSDGFAEISFRVVGDDEKNINNGNSHKSRDIQNKDERIIDEKESNIDMDEVIDHFESINKDEYIERINPTLKLTGLASFRRLLLGPPKLSSELQRDRDFIFILALVSYDNNNELHWRILQTIYYSLTREKIKCARYGSHWDVIGFQGNDPATDLRGCGMLGLVSILAFLKSNSTSSLARKIYVLSQDEIQNFPFSIMAINVTRITLQILREEKLNKECNHRLKNLRTEYEKEGNAIVWNLFQQMFSAIFYSIYKTWKEGHKTMADSGFVLKEIEDNAKYKPHHILNSYLHSTNKRKNEKSNSDNDKIEKFVGIEDL